MTPHARIPSCVAAIILAIVAPVVMQAQQPVPSHTVVQLSTLQDRALQNDPRTEQFELLKSQSSLRMSDIHAGRLPQIGATAQGQYQSQVVTLPFRLPDGVAVPGTPHDTYDASLMLQESLYDPTVGARRGVERASLAASQASLRTSLYSLRKNVNDAYFAALLQQARNAEQQLALRDLQAHYAVAQSRVAEGTALPSEADMLAAELVKGRQAIAALAASRAAAVTQLRDLTGAAISVSDTLALPDLAAAVARARSELDTIRSRPEYAQFARSRDLVQEQQASLATEDLPRISAFGRTGYGRPGLNPLSRDFQGYWLAGVKLEWSPWNWGTTRRDRESLTLQNQIVATDEAAFQRDVARNATTQLSTIDQLAGTLAADDTVIALRERILRETDARYQEAVITSAEYIDRETDLLNARLTRATHRVQLAQARANFLTSLGLEVR